MIIHMDGVVLCLQISWLCLMLTPCSSVTGTLGSRVWASPFRMEFLGFPSGNFSLQDDALLPEKVG